MNNTLADLIIVSSECGDWEALYVNGKLEKEGHSIYECDWIEIIEKFKFFSGKIEKYYVFDDFLEEIGCFPIKFEEISVDFLIK